MLTRYDVLTIYARRLLVEGVDTEVIREAAVRSKFNHVEVILKHMFEGGFFHEGTCDHETIWDIYAEKQKERYRTLLDMPSLDDRDVTRCYICAEYVGRELHDRFPYGEWDHDTSPGGIRHWNISHIFANSRSGCGENFNIRICCRKCNVHTGTATPVEDATRRCFPKDRSLARREKITTPAKAFHCYFRYYSGSYHWQ